ncbi:MAG: chemotaxis response regulator protein-glutamate methylesterase [Fimbriimonadales bacterium]|nr:MAG: chemotaxis response regulator protein-glutamate methylesterase [Fimbriimonadales bacterium]GIV07741.1 MAG: chemotaxis response regulator protein-glutamate methylesterase [Fimbriimonadales bacterium]
MSKIRVLVVDDSMFMRRMVTDLLNRDAAIEVIGAAKNGQEGLEMARRLKPDVITLDVEMPVMDGVTMLQQLMQEQKTPVLMLSSLTTEGAEVTLKCLDLGAVDFVAKPSGSISLDIYKISSQIIEKVKAVAKARVTTAPVAVVAPSAPPQPSPQFKGGAHDAPLVVIGASTGGPRALNVVMSRLPLGLNAKILLIQHMPEGFTRSLAERLDRSSAFSVYEAQGGETLQAGVAYLAQGGKHLKVERGGRLTLTQDPPVHGVRPAVDVALLSLAQTYQGALVVAILTGMGSDGAAGLRALHAKGAYTIAEDESTCVVFGMPRAAIQTGCVKRVAPLHQIAEAITEGVKELCNKFQAA